MLFSTGTLQYHSTAMPLFVLLQSPSSISRCSHLPQLFGTVNQINPTQGTVMAEDLVGAASAGVEGERLLVLCTRDGVVLFFFFVALSLL